MSLTGEHIIGGHYSKLGNDRFQAVNPESGKKLTTEFCEATRGELDEAIQQAEVAFQHYRRVPGNLRADFLETIGEEIMALGKELISQCMQETGLPEGRLIGERARTVNQLKMFAELLREGSWLDARIDTALPDREPLPKPDLRQMQIALGPVGIFGASNFPFAFSVAGGDTASALAAGCSIVVKGHPSHPGTSELVGRAIKKAVKSCGMPKGVFSLLQGQSSFVGMSIVKHPLIKAIGFTGSYGGGKAIFDAAAKRKEPIPVYAEMGSTNPLFVLPDALKKRNGQIAEGLVNSVTLGVGQFCTNPGVVMSMKSEESKAFRQRTGELMQAIESGPMLSEKIRQGYMERVEKFSGSSGVDVLGKSKSASVAAASEGYVFQTDARTYLSNPDLHQEVFGPATLHVEAGSREELLKVAANLEGHLTATLQATEEDLNNFSDLIEILERKVGRLIINGFPTGVEVCHSMVHGGPFPATTDARSTSVGTGAIHRFTRPVCYQGFPQFALPEELRDDNPLDIWRLVNGERSKASI